MVNRSFVAQVGRRRIFGTVDWLSEDACRCRDDWAEAGFVDAREKAFVLKAMFEICGRSRNLRCSGSRSLLCIDLAERHRDLEHPCGCQMLQARRYLFVVSQLDLTLEHGSALQESRHRTRTANCRRLSKPESTSLSRLAQNYIFSV